MTRKIWRWNQPGLAPPAALYGAADVHNSTQVVTNRSQGRSQKVAKCIKIVYIFVACWQGECANRPSLCRPPTVL